MMRSRRFGNASEPWEVAMERLRALPANPTEEQTAHALVPIGVSTTLSGSEAIRVLSMLGVKGSTSALLKTAAIPRGHASNTQYYSAVRLVEAVHAKRARARTASSSSAARKKALAALPETARNRLAWAVGREKSAVERAQAYEKLAKAGAHPKWAAKVERRSANEAKRQRIALEDQLLAGRFGSFRRRSTRRFSRRV